MNALKTSYKTYFSLFLWVAAYLAVAAVIGNMTRSEIPGWYAGLAKPALNPPDFIFPIVWTTLYIMMATCGFRLWRGRGQESGRLLFGLFAVQTVMNWAWSYFFFDFHRLDLSFFWIIGLDLVVAALIALAWKRDRVSALLLMPYLVWILFASYLNGMIWTLN